MRVRTAVLALLAAAAVLVVLLVTFTDSPPQSSPPAPKPVASPTDPRASYYAIEVTHCLPSLDPNLRRYFLRQGQCPVGATKR
jgi:hypothetical protein